MKDQVRIAFIGAGRMANAVHYPSLASFPDVEIAAICDVAEGPLHQTADRYQIPRRYTDFRQMIADTAPDGVYAIGQPHIMFDIWTWCLNHRQNLYIEKPMGLTWHQAQVLTHLAERHHLITQVSHQRRSSPLLRLLRERCLRHGPITHAVCEFYKPGPQPYLEARDRMMDDCTHAIDTLRWLCDSEVVRVESRWKRVDTPDINWISAFLDFENGATGVLLTSWCSGRRIFRVEMHAPGIVAEADVEGTGTVFERGVDTGITFDAREVAGSSELYIYGGFQAKHREFIDSLKTGQETTSSPFRDCLKTMAIAETILAQALEAST